MSIVNDTVIFKLKATLGIDNSNENNEFIEMTLRHVQSFSDDFYDCVVLCGSHCSGENNSLSDVDVFIFQELSEPFYYRRFKIFEGVPFEFNFINTKYLGYQGINAAVEHKLRHELKRFLIVSDKTNGYIPEKIREFTSRPLEHRIEQSKVMKRTLFSLALVMMDLAGVKDKNSLTMMMSLIYQKYTNFLLIYHGDDIFTSFKHAEYLRQSIPTFVLLSDVYRQSIATSNPNTLIDFIFEDLAKINHPFTYDFEEKIY